MDSAENGLPLSKKRVAGRELTKDNADLDDDTPEQEGVTFQRASEEVLTTRRIVKVRRQQPQSASSSNPFTGLRFTSPSDSSASTTSSTAQPQITSVSIHGKIDEDKKIDSASLVNEQNRQDEANMKLKDVTEVPITEDNKNFVSGVVEDPIQPVATHEVVLNGGEKTNREASKETGKEDTKETEKEAGEDIERPVNKESDKNAGEETAKETQESTEKVVTEEIEKEKSVDSEGPGAPFSSFQQLSSSQNAFAGLAKTGFSSSSFSFGPICEGSAFASSGSLFGLKNSNNENPLGTGAADVTKTGVGGSMQEVPVETGEENEKAVFNAGAILYEYVDGGWKERGKGELKVNTSITGVERARLVMRTKGNYRLILNASLYPDILLTDMEKRGVTFACVNSAGAGKSGLTTFALKFKDSCTVEEFRGTVTAHKGKKAAPLKTPDSSPKASAE